MADVTPIGVGVLGAADIAWRRTVPAIVACDRLRLAAVASRTPEKAGAFAERFGGAAVTGYQRLLARDDVQAVYVALPNALHEEWTDAALRAGKHVLVEKSLTVDATVAARLADTARDAGLALVENFAFLDHPQHAWVRDRIAEGAIGDVRNVSASFGVPQADPTLIRYNRELAGGALRETGCYPVRLAAALLGPDVEVVGARLHEDPETGVDISGAALLADSAGVTAQCDFGLAHAYRNTYAVWGSTGRIEVDWAFTPPPGTRPVVRVHRADTVTEHRLPAVDQFQRMVTGFAEACADPTRRPAHRSAVVGQATLLEAIVRQADPGRSVAAGAGRTGGDRGIA
ncbi:Gfo/Idh/MocA family protein [Micromonospora mangrovi]|uniref:Gfo/Idh/MocA family oxidoreductase n=2 Tax=Micromonospora TaxID=1873 RepID=A0AAU7MF07_9ACTN